MGNKNGGLFGLGKKQSRILLVGLDSAGKTTILYRLKLKDLVNTTPTLGFNVETINYKKLQLTVWDVGGQVKLRELWEHYYDTCDAVIFILDSSDVDRLNECKNEFTKMLSDKKLKNVAVLVYANKQDLKGAKNKNEISEILQIKYLPQKKVLVQECSGKDGTGIFEGLDWLGQNI